MYGYDIFHNDIAEEMIDAVRGGRNPHAWIISGEEGLGRHTLSELIAAAVVCQNLKNAPCGECRSCVMAKAGTHPDIKHVLPEDKKKTIGAQEVRRLNDDVFIKPFFSDKKVYIIEGDLLTAQAQNTFLKTLEEPPLYAVFIIIVSDAEKLLPTVRSRCAAVQLPVLKSEELSEYIKSKYSGLSENADFYVRFSGGNPGRALELIESGEFDILRSKCFEIIGKILSSKMSDAFYVSDFFDKNKEKAGDIIEIMLLFFRDMLFIGCGYINMVINSDYAGRMREAGVYTAAMPYAIDTLTVCSEMVTRNVSPKHMGAYLAFTLKDKLRRI